MVTDALLLLRTQGGQDVIKTLVRSHVHHFIIFKGIHMYYIMRLIHSQEYIFDLYFVDKEITIQRCTVTWLGSLAGKWQPGT